MKSSVWADPNQPNGQTADSGRTCNVRTNDTSDARSPPVVDTLRRSGFPFPHAKARACERRSFAWYPYALCVCRVWTGAEPQTGWQPGFPPLR